MPDVAISTEIERFRDRFANRSRNDPERFVKYAIRGGIWGRGVHRRRTALYIPTKRKRGLLFLRFGL